MSDFRNIITKLMMNKEPELAPGEARVLPREEILGDMPLTPASGGLRQLITYMLERGITPREDINQGVVFPGGGIHQKINARDVLYHATPPENLFKDILDSGITKIGGSFQQHGPLGSQGGFKGVSTSRVPYISTIPRPATVVLDRNKIKARPYAEQGFEKGQGSTYSTDFEFESRSRDPIKPNAIQQVLLNRQGMGAQQLEAVVGQLQSKGIPFQIYDNPRQMLADRVHSVYSDKLKKKELTVKPFVDTKKMGASIQPVKKEPYKGWLDEVPKNAPTQWSDTLKSALNKNVDDMTKEEWEAFVAYMAGQ